MQLDRPERGFSYAVDAPLDMRMDPSADVLRARARQRGDERELADIFKRYGEERYARQIARAIVRRRSTQPFERTGDLVEVIKAAIPAPARFGEGHPAKRVFQALRIEVNDELGALERALPAALEMLRPGGRLGVISFHSLEDRIVKQFLRNAGARLHVPARLPGLRLRLEADDARDAAPGDPAERRRGRPQPARAVGAPPRRDEGLMASLSHAQAARSPSRSRGRARALAAQARARRSARGGILWIAVSGILLAGVVFVNVAVLQLNLALDSTNARARRSSSPRTPRCSRSTRQLVASPRDPGAGASSSSGSSTRTRPTTATSTSREVMARQAGQPADPPAARRLRARLRRDARARRVAAGRPRGHARAAWRERQHARDDRRSPPAAARSSTAPASSSRSASRRRPSTPTRSEVTEPRAVAIAAHSILGVDANVLYPQLLNKKTRFVYVAALRRPDAGRDAS